MPQVTKTELDNDDWTVRQAEGMKRPCPVKDKARFKKKLMDSLFLQDTPGCFQNVCARAGQHYRSHLSQSARRRSSPAIRNALFQIVTDRVDIDVQFFRDPFHATVWQCILDMPEFFKSDDHKPDVLLNNRMHLIILRFSGFQNFNPDPGKIRPIPAFLR